MKLLVELGAHADINMIDKVSSIQFSLYSSIGHSHTKRYRSQRTMRFECYILSHSSLYNQYDNVFFCFQLFVEQLAFQKDDKEYLLNDSITQSGSLTSTPLLIRSFTACKSP